jgi:hypothetical protein
MSKLTKIKAVFPHPIKPLPMFQTRNVRAGGLVPVNKSVGHIEGLIKSSRVTPPVSIDTGAAGHYNR